MTKHSTKSPEVNSCQKQKAQEITSTCETVKVSILPLCNLPAATRHYAALHQIVFFSTKTTKCNDILNVKFIHSSRLESHQHEHTCTELVYRRPRRRPLSSTFPQNFCVKSQPRLSPIRLLYLVTLCL